MITELTGQDLPHQRPDHALELDRDHADVDGRSALASAVTLNRVLAGNVDGRGFVTNEHRYLAVTQNARPETGMHAQSGQ